MAVDNFDVEGCARHILWLHTYSTHVNEVRVNVRDVLPTGFDKVAFDIPCGLPFLQRSKCNEFRSQDTNNHPDNSLGDTSEASW
jgi:hypothetical protein